MHFGDVSRRWTWRMCVFQIMSLGSATGADDRPLSTTWPLGEMVGAPFWRYVLYWLSVLYNVMGMLVINGRCRSSDRGQVPYCLWVSAFGTIWICRKVAAGLHVSGSRPVLPDLQCTPPASRLPPASLSHPAAKQPELPRRGLLHLWALGPQLAWVWTP